MKLKTKIRKTNKAVQTFIKQTIKNYKSMKDKIKTLWLAMLFFAIAISGTSCNVTRTITNESKYYQKGDTAVTIQTKTVETYNAEKK